MECCDLISSCLFVKNSSFELPHRADFLKEKYCRNRFCDCARFIIHSAYGSNMVPRNLSPDDLCMNHRRYINSSVPKNLHGSSTNIQSGIIPQMASSCQP